MRKIAILTCLNACQVCTGASCFAAWNRRERGFALYAGETTSLEAFFHCNGCGKDPETDPGMLEKLDWLERVGVDAVHTGVCTVRRETRETCPTITQIIEMLRQRGISVVHGTH